MPRTGREGNEFDGEGKFGGTMSEVEGEEVVFRDVADA